MFFPVVVKFFASKPCRFLLSVAISVSFLFLQVRLREAASLDQHALLRKLREVLEALQGRVSGSNKDDAEEALTIVSQSLILNRRKSSDQNYDLLLL
jgi:hypothetical protein